MAVDLTLETLLYAANFILILIAFFLLIRLKRSKKKSEPEKEKQPQEKKSELAGIADLKPEEFKLERLEIRRQDLIPSEVAKQMDSGAGLRAEAKEEPKEKLPERPSAEPIYPAAVLKAEGQEKIELKPQSEQPGAKSPGSDLEKAITQMKEELKERLAEKTAILPEPGAGLKVTIPKRNDLELEDEPPEEIFEMPAEAQEQEVIANDRVKAEERHVEEPTVTSKDVEPEVIPPGKDEIKTGEELAGKPPSTPPGETEPKIMTLENAEVEVKVAEKPPSTQPGETEPKIMTLGKDEIKVEGEPEKPAEVLSKDKEPKIMTLGKDEIKVEEKLAVKPPAMPPRETELKTMTLENAEVEVKVAEKPLATPPRETELKIMTLGKDEIKVEEEQAGKSPLTPPRETEPKIMTLENAEVEVKQAEKPPATLPRETEPKIMTLGEDELSPGNKQPESPPAILSGNEESKKPENKAPKRESIF